MVRTSSLPNKESAPESRGRSHSLAEKAYQGIKRMFWVGELTPGQKLRYQDIARKLNVSMTPIINALTRLEDEGLVGSQAHKGYFVPELDLKEAKELYDIRLMLETSLIEHVIPRISDADLKHIKKLIDEHRTRRSDMYTRERLYRDSRLHLAIAGVSGHQTGLQYLRQVFERLFLRYRPEKLSAERMAGAEREHLALWEALGQMDAVKARHILKDHIDKGQAHILTGLSREAQFRNTFSPWE